LTDSHSTPPPHAFHNTPTSPRLVLSTRRRLSAPLAICTFQLAEERWRCDQLFTAAMVPPAWVWSLRQVQSGERERLRSVHRRWERRVHWNVLFDAVVGRRVLVATASQMRSDCSGFRGYLGDMVSSPRVCQDGLSGRYGELTTSVSRRLETMLFSLTDETCPARHVRDGVV
jgi:hypothetical protein